MRMRKITDYDLVVQLYEPEKGGPDEFVAEVNEKLVKGWYPLGPPFLSGKNWSFMVQTIVKYEEKLEDAF